jgi:hypothetical protein
MSVPARGQTACPICASAAPGIPRRRALQALLSLPLALVPVPAAPAPAAPALDLEQYRDAAGGFALLRPSAWARDRIVDGRRFARDSGGGGPGVAFEDVLDPTQNISVLARPVGGARQLADIGPPAGFGRKMCQAIQGGPAGSVRSARMVRAFARDGGSGDAGDVYYEVEYLVVRPARGAGDR